MAINQIASSGLQAHARAVEHAAHNIAQALVDDPTLYRTRYTALGSSDRPAGVRAEAEVVARAVERSSAPGVGLVLDPRVEETFAEVDLVQQLTDVVVARRAFQASLAVQRSSRAFIEATLNITA